jgi:VanZ family protein
VIAALLIVYWIALFVATHLPHVPSALETRISDKSLHGGSYALLALLLAAWHGMRRKVTWSTALGMLAIIAAYGAFDELTQIPVGRHADILDWRADIVGGIIGIGAYILAQRLIRSVGQRRERAGELDV